MVIRCRWAQDVRRTLHTHAPGACSTYATAATPATPCILHAACHTAYTTCCTHLHMNRHRHHHFHTPPPPLPPLLQHAAHARHRTACLLPPRTCTLPRLRLCPFLMVAAAHAARAPAPALHAPLLLLRPTAHYTAAPIYLPRCLTRTAPTLPAFATPSCFAHACPLPLPLTAWRTPATHLPTVCGVQELWSYGPFVVFMGWGGQFTPAYLPTCAFRCTQITPLPHLDLPIIHPPPTFHPAPVTSDRPSSRPVTLASTLAHFTACLPRSTPLGLPHLHTTPHLHMVHLPTVPHTPHTHTHTLGHGLAGHGLIAPLYHCYPPPSQLHPTRTPTACGLWFCPTARTCTPTPQPRAPTTSTEPPGPAPLPHTPPHPHMPLLPHTHLACHQLHTTPRMRAFYHTAWYGHSKFGLGLYCISVISILV